MTTKSNLKQESMIQIESNIKVVENESVCEQTDEIIDSNFDFDDNCYFYPDQLNETQNFIPITSFKPSPYTSPILKARYTDDNS